MSSKDYEKTAAILAGERAIHKVSGEGAMGDSINATIDKVIDHVAGGLADMFAQDSPRFDRKRFMLAAGVNQD